MAPASGVPCQGCGDAIPEGAARSERVSDGAPFCAACARENAAGEHPDEMREGAPATETGAPIYSCAACGLLHPARADGGRRADDARTGTPSAEEIAERWWHDGGEHHSPPATYEAGIRAERARVAALAPALPPDLEAIRARAEAATPGPWKWDGQGRPDEDEDGRPLPPYVPQCSHLGGTGIALDNDNENSRYDCAFIAHARADVPALLSALAERDRLVAALRESLAFSSDAHTQAGRDRNRALAEIDRLDADVAALRREVARHVHGEQVEGDYVCPHEMEAERLRAVAEAERLATAETLAGAERDRLAAREEIDGLTREATLQRASADRLAAAAEALAADREHHKGEAERLRAKIDAAEEILAGWRGAHPAVAAALAALT